jgi:hypothetical protein
MKRGNPTRSREILDLIKYMKKKEVRHQGVASQACRPLTLEEFRSMVNALQNGVAGTGEAGPLSKYGIPVQMCFQFHLIVRIDCVCQFQGDNLKPHDRFPLQALKVKLYWSKNMLEERDAPGQTILGAIDSSFCVLLNLALWLELSCHRTSPYVFNFSEDITVPSGGVKAKNRVMDVLRVVLRELQLNLEEGEVGTHSIRKCALTHVRGNGVSKDDKDTRGRWKVTGRVSDRYDSVQLPYVDTKVASTLCIGGACTYVLNEAVPPRFILEQVAPEIREQFGSQVALVLGTTLIWACFDMSVSHLVPLTMKGSVVAADSHLQVLPQGFTPVERCLVIVTGDNENVSLTQVSRKEATAIMDTVRGGWGGCIFASLIAQI